MTVSTVLPILPLLSPVVLLPTSKITIPITTSQADSLIALQQSAHSNFILAVVPLITGESDERSLNEWGVTARILRLFNAPFRPVLARNLDSATRYQYLLSLHALDRVRLSKPLPAPATLILQHSVRLPASGPSPDPGTIDAFRGAARRIIDLRLRSEDGARREAWSQIADMLDGDRDISDRDDERSAWVADVLVAGLKLDHADKLAYLRAHEHTARLQQATAIFVKLISLLNLNTKISTSVNDALAQQEKELLLRQQLAVIRRELQSFQKPSAGSELDADRAEEDGEDMAVLGRKVEAMEKSSEERKMGTRELRRLKRIPQGSVEHGVIRSYLEWLTALPWPNSTLQPPAQSQHLSLSDFLGNARKQLDTDHFGLDKIKRRLIEYLTVVCLKEEQQSAAENDSNSTEAGTFIHGTRTGKNGVKGPILLFVGPPGTGKTSLGQSVAKALARPFQRISLGGVRDEAEIRGHRRTYVASGPGLIVQALRRAGRLDPVLLLDEIDKVGHSNFHGDPAAALLEVLDPEQNHTFNDHYINVPIDLSKVVFICTANTTDTISAPLLDRCEAIQLSGYTYDEKQHIARRFLVPKQLRANALTTAQISITDEALREIATKYTHEAGVRNLERAIGSVMRFKAVEWAHTMPTYKAGKNERIEARKSDKPIASYNNLVEVHELEKILGVARWDEEREREERRGVVYGLVVMGQGEGGVMPVESMVVPGSGKLILTGSLGEVLKESGELALSWVKRHAYGLCITDSPVQNPLKVPEPIDIHLHLPAGAQKKDGPSAGLAILCAFVSLLTGACVPAHVAMTGEINLRGSVTPVGGIKEKVLGAHRAQIKTIVLPWANRKEIDSEVAPEIRSSMKLVFVRTVEEALEAAFGKKVLAWRYSPVLFETRL